MRSPLLLSAVLVLLVACGGDDTGSGELFVDGDRFGFEVESCLAGEQDTGAAEVAFHLSGSGESSRGRPYDVEARIIDLGEDLGRTQYVGLRFSDREEDGYESLPDLSGQGPTLEVNDGEVFFAGGFIAVSDQESVGDGEFRAECP